MSRTSVAVGAIGGGTQDKLVRGEIDGEQGRLAGVCGRIDLKVQPHHEACAEKPLTAADPVCLGLYPISDTVK